MLKAPRKPNISKTVVYAIAVNALQILALLVFVVYVFLMDFSWQNRISLRTIAVVGALVAVILVSMYLPMFKLGNVLG